MKSIAAAMALALTAWAQQNEGVIRITTSLVQIDAIVTDGDGRAVPDLKASDFEILQDGKRRDITAFSFVKIAPNSRDRARAEASRSTSGIAPPQLAPTGTTREQVRRTVAILVDDLSIGFADMPRVRQAVTRFVQEEVREGDLVAIVTAAGGMGIYSQFSADRTLLLAAADRLVWNGRIDPSQQPDITTVPGYEESRALQIATRGSVLDAISALRNMPGRKSVVFFSAGNQVIEPTDPMLDRIADEATRAAVTVYTIDVRGVQTFMPTAEEANPNYVAASARAAAAFNSQRDMSYLAERTGGLFFRNDNGLRELLVQALDDQSSYYLMGYNPGQQSFDRKFHKIEVRVLRPGLKVRSRTGYMGVEERSQGQVLEVASRRMVRALLAPFQANDIHTRLSATFRADGNLPRVQSRLWIDANDLEFEHGPDGKYHAEVEVIVASFDPQGKMTEHTERGYRTSLTEEQYAEARRSGVLYSIAYAVKKPGPYQVRMALRDINSKRVGTASQFLITPDLKKERLTLSGIVVQGLEDQKRREDVSRPSMVLVRLGRGIEWTAQVYHPKLVKGMPRLTAALRLYRDGEMLFEGKPEPVEVTKKNERNVPVSGSVMLRENNPPGDYVLQLIVRDENDKSNAVTQAIGFQVAP